MCGFVGIVSHDGLDARHRTAVENAARSIRHRGPDSEGIVSAPFAHVAFRRLSVVDLTGGHQPLANEDGSVQAFLNGEIFNHRDLRRDLERLGHVLRTNSDTEVLPHLWEEHGPDLLAHLNGMFTVCIVDHRRREVFIARDRIGIKPMFVASTRFGTVFGSELKAVLATDLVPRDLATEAAVRFVDSLSADGRTTLIKGVERLLPGEALHLRPDRADRRYRWYDLAAELTGRPETSDPRDVLELMADSVSLRLHADVPVGVSLSGGVDSTFLALMARDMGHEDIAAFTVDFEDTPEEEIASARAVAGALGLRHEVLRSGTADFVRDAPSAIWFADEPVADPAFYPALQIAEAASRSVTVLLAGSGADELFAGYGRHRLSWKRALAARAPFLAQRAIRAQAPSFGLDENELEALFRYGSDRFDWHARAMTHLTAGERSVLAAPGSGSLDPLGLLRHAFARYAGDSGLEQQLFADTVTYLPDQLLPLLDRTTMAYSIEGRVPFLDHRVVEAALRLPDSTKLGPHGTTKLLLRNAMRGRVPDIVLERPKLGFPNAVPSWLRGRLGDLLPALLDHPDGVLRTVFPGAWLEALMLDRESIQRRWTVVYALVTLEIWHRVLVVEGWDDPPSATLEDLYPVRAPVPSR